MSGVKLLPLFVKFLGFVFPFLLYLLLALLGLPELLVVLGLVLLEPGFDFAFCFLLLFIDLLSVDDIHAQVVLVQLIACLHFKLQLLQDFVVRLGDEIALNFNFVLSALLCVLNALLHFFKFLLGREEVLMPF